MAFESIHTDGARRRKGLPGAPETARLIAEDGLDYEEVALLFDVSPSTVKARLHHAGYSLDGTPIERAPKVDVLAELAAASLQPAGAWVDEALCAQTDNEIFFPDKGGSSEAAKRVCGRCPVRQECLELALANGERFGIWGGTSERERRKLTSQQKEAS